MKRNRNLESAIGTLGVAVLFAALGIYAYTHNMYIRLFKFIPLNEITCAIIAILFLGFAVFQLIAAPRKDKQELEGITSLTQGLQETAIAATPLTSVCAVTVVFEKKTFVPNNALKVLLNGYEVGIANKKVPITFGTNVAENTLTLLNVKNALPISFPFTAVSSGQVTLTVGTGPKGIYTVTQS